MVVRTLMVVPLTLKINNSVLNIELNDQNSRTITYAFGSDPLLKIILILSNLILETIVNQFFRIHPIHWLIR